MNFSQVIRVFDAPKSFVTSFNNITKLNVEDVSNYNIYIITGTNVTSLEKRRRPSYGRKYGSIGLDQ